LYLYGDSDNYNKFIHWINDISSGNYTRYWNVKKSYQYIIFQILMKKRMIKYISMILVIKIYKKWNIKGGNAMTNN